MVTDVIASNLAKKARSFTTADTSRACTNERSRDN